MRRLALLIAAAILGTGCVFYDDNCDDQRVTLGWTTFQTAEGATLGCSAADVVAVDVWVNGFSQAFDVDCNALAVTVPIAPGANFVTVEGIDSLGRIAYRDQVTVQGSSCGNHGTVPTQPAEGFFEVDYSFSPVNQCAVSPTFIWLMVNDDVAAQTAFVENGTTLDQQCSLVLPAPRYRLPVGSFTLLGVEEVTASGFTLGADCSDRPFEITASLTTVVQPVLLNSSLACF